MVSAVQRTDTGPTVSTDNINLDLNSLISTVDETFTKGSNPVYSASDTSDLVQGRKYRVWGCGNDLVVYYQQRR
jgi:hypothetical protein